MLSTIGRKILQYISSCDSYVSGEELSKICNVSINTIRKEIDLINHELTGRGCFIETKVAVGYSLTIRDPRAAAPFLTQSLKEFRRFDYLNYSEFSMAYQILMKLLIASSYTSIEALVGCLFCSRSTILRTMDQVQLILNPFHLEMKVRRNYGLIIQGDEWSKRICLIFLHKVFAHENKPQIYEGAFGALFLNQTDYPQILQDQILRYFGRHREITIPNIHVIKLTQYILLAKTRSRYASAIQYTEDQLNHIRQLSAFKAARELYASLPAYFKENLHENDILSLAALIACCMTLKSADQIPLEDQPVIFQEVRDSLAFIRQHYELEGCLDASFYDAFAGYLYCLNLKKEFNFCTDSEELTTSTKIGLWTADLCSLFALFYKNKTGVHLNETDLAEVYYIFNAAIYKQNYTFNKMNLAVVSRQGRYYSESIAARLMTYSSRYIESLEVLEATELYETELDVYDAIITDIYFSSLPKNYHGAYIEFNHHRDSPEYKDLSDFLIQFFNQQALPLFQPANFHKTDFKQKQDVYDAIFSFYASELGDREAFFRDLQMRDSFISNEKKQDLVLITSLAMRISRPVFQVFVNHKPIFWNQNKAHVFIFYQYGDGSRENVQRISYLLKQFLHQNALFLNTLYEQSYDEVVGCFNIL